MRAIMCGFALVLALAGLSDGLRAQTVISVIGRAEVAAIPDMALVRVGVTFEGQTASQAMESVSGAVADIIARVQRLGVEKRDIQTSGFSLNPLFRTGIVNSKQQITGFVARNGVTLTIRDLGKIGPILGEAIATGSNTISGIEFMHSDPAPLIREARGRAVRDAVEAGDVLAAAAGLEVRDVAQISMDHNAVPRVAMARAARFAASGSPPIEAGELRFTAQVRMVFTAVPLPSD